MFVTILLIFVLLLSALKYIEVAINGRDNGVPMYPGALPFINHAWEIMGNSIKVWQLAKNVSMKSLENNGYVTLMLGPIKYYMLSDPDDCELLMNRFLEKTYIYSFGKPWFGEGLLTAPTAKWLRNRKLLNPMFNLQVINGFLGIFNDQARVLVKRFEKYPPGTDFNHEKDILLVGLQTICRTALGVENACLKEGADYVEAIDGITIIVMKRIRNVLLHSDFLFRWTSLKKQQDQYLKIINELAERYIQKWKSQYEIEDFKINNKSDYSLFIHCLLKMAQKNHFTHEEIRDEINTFIAAGYDTVATAIMIALMYIGHYKDVQEKMYEEIRSVFGDSEHDVSKDDVRRLVYMDATLKEVMRVSPIGPLVTRYTETDIKLKQYTIPKNSNVIISIYAINRHPSWGPDRHLFRPERWLEPEQIPKPNFFLSFAFGKRNCIGKTYAMLFMKTILVHILRRFVISSDLSKLELKMEVLMKAARGLHISLTPRRNTVKA